jgi:hypothetical protein
MKTFAPAAVAFLVLAIASPAMAASPPNDNFADAMKARVGQEYSGDLAEATAELGEPRHGPVGPHHTVWFRYRSPRNAHLTIDTGGSDVDTVLAAYTGSDVSDLHLIASDDDSSPTGQLGSTIRFKAHRGRTYRIVVDSYASEPDVTAFKLWISDGGIKGKGVAMRVDPDQTVAGVRSHGLRLHITARRKVGMAVALRVSRTVAHRLGLPSRVLGRTHGTIDYGQALVATIQLTRPARKALRDVDSLKAKVRLSLPRTTAPDKSLTARVAL